MGERLEFVQTDVLTPSCGSAGLNSQVYGMPTTVGAVAMASGGMNGQVVQVDTK